MSTRELKCAERIEDYLASREESLAAILTGYYDGDEQAFE